MGKKKKGGGKGKKAKKDVVEEVEEKTEFDEMGISQLDEAAKALEDQLEKAQLDRNYVQLERDTIQTFYDITKREVKDCEQNIVLKDREMETMEENHRVEVRVYIQKVKHLEYEHKNQVKRVSQEGEAKIGDATDAHSKREAELLRHKKSLKLELLEAELNDEERVKQMKEAHQKNLSKMKESFEANLVTLRERYEARQDQLRADLELRRKVEIHEIEERKNLHVNDLMKNHEKAFGQIKNYYNDITHDNLKLIQSLKDEVSEMKKKAAANQKLMYDIAQENKRLSEPLAVAVKEVEQLRHSLKDYQKDKLSLKNASARLVLLEEQLRVLTEEHKTLETNYGSVEEKRNELLASFESTIEDVQRKSEFKNLVLERKLRSMNDDVSEKKAQFSELVREVDPVMLTEVTSKLDEEIDRRNLLIKELEYHLSRVEKSHNDAIRTYEAKLTEFGIPPEEVQLIKPLKTRTSTLPAGLVYNK